MFESENFGDNWRSTVSAWYSFEEKHNFKTGTRLGCSGRPPIIGRWIQLARDPSLTREKAGSANLNGIDADFWGWWAGLQPAWRKVLSEMTSRDVDGSWSALDKSGANGLLSVVAALQLWRRFGSDPELESWSRAVDDVHWVLEQIRTTL